MTFSVVGRCRTTGAMGVAIASSSPAVAARCAWVRGGVGAVTTQNVTDPRLGPALLDALASGTPPGDAVAVLVSSRDQDVMSWRQLTAVDVHGRATAWTGSNALGVHGQVVRDGLVVAGNLLTSTSVLDAAADEFERDGDAALGRRLLDGMAAALAAGGEAGPVHSAGLLVAAADEVCSWPVTDLRIDWHDDPVAALDRLWQVWEPQQEAYVSRALDPAGSPSYRVPGDRR
jgi:uncharacterized Ntn-hydrolase superfamily protein